MQEEIIDDDATGSPLDDPNDASTSFGGLRSFFLYYCGVLTAAVKNVGNPTKLGLVDMLLVANDCDVRTDKIEELMHR